MALPANAGIFPIERAMKRLFSAVCLFIACICLHAQTTVWQPSPGHIQIPIWPHTPPNLQKVDGPERAEIRTDPKGFIAGKPATAIYNVTRPTMTVYSPKAGSSGAAVVVFPGEDADVCADSAIKRREVMDAARCTCFMANKAYLTESPGC